MFVLELTLCTPVDWSSGLRTKDKVCNVLAKRQGTSPILLQGKRPAQEANFRHLGLSHCLMKTERLASFLLLGEAVVRK